MAEVQNAYAIGNACARLDDFCQDAGGHLCKSGDVQSVTSITRCCVRTPVPCQWGSSPSWMCCTSLSRHRRFHRLQTTSTAFRRVNNGIFPNKMVNTSFGRSCWRGSVITCRYLSMFRTCLYGVHLLLLGIDHRAGVQGNT